MNCYSNEDLEKIKERVFSRNPPSIKNKRECYVLYESGFFGNKSLTWNFYQEIIESGWKGKVCMRSKKGIKRGGTKYNIKLQDLKKEISAWKREGIQEREINFNQSMPDEKILIQGEVARTNSGLFLLYTTIKKPMNLALAEEERRAYELSAKIILQKTLSSSSLSDIESLLEIFPNDVIEFSSYSIPIGNLRGRNAVIWEVRNY